MKVAGSADELAAMGAEAVQAAMAGNGARTVFFLGGKALLEGNLETLGRIAATAGADLVCQTFPARLQRGAGRVPVTRLPYFAEQACAALAGYEQIILVGAAAPVSFFAYPGKASWLAPEGSEILTLATAKQDIAAAVSNLADAVSASGDHTPRAQRKIASAAEGALTPQAIGQVMKRLERARLIRISYGKVFIRDIESLIRPVETLIGGEPVVSTYRSPEG